MTKVVHSDSYPAVSPLSFREPTNSCVFIAGASHGIGLAISKSFSQSGASHIAIGARSDLSSAKDAILDAALNASRPAPNVLVLKFDITSQYDVEAAATSVEQEFGRLDIVVINSGIMGAMTLIADSDPDVWWNAWNVNLRGPYLVTKFFLPLLLKGGDKTIVTTSSVGGHLVTPSLSTYQLTKLAVIRLMEFISAEYKDKGVVSFCIHPGNVVTDRVGGADALTNDLKPSKCFIEKYNLGVLLTKRGSIC